MCKEGRACSCFSKYILDDLIPLLSLISENNSNLPQVDVGSMLRC